MNNLFDVKNYQDGEFQIDFFNLSCEILLYILRRKRGWDGCFEMGYILSFWTQDKKMTFNVMTHKK